MLVTCVKSQSKEKNNLNIKQKQYMQLSSVKQESSYVLIQLINNDVKLFFYDEIIIVDGDMIKLHLNKERLKYQENKIAPKIKKNETIRLLGIDSPGNKTNPTASNRLITYPNS